MEVSRSFWPSREHCTTYTVTSLCSVVFLYRVEQGVNVGRHISVVAGKWIMAMKERTVADECRICKDNLSSMPFSIETVGTAHLILSVREVLLQ